MKTIHPAIAEHVMEENERLREALQAMLDECDPMKLNCGDPWCRARAALSQQAEPLYVTHLPLIRNAINLLGMRRPVAPDVQRVIDDLEAMLDGQSTPAGAPSEEWMQVATLAEPAPAQDEQQPVPDAVWEALQRMIESTSLMGPHSREDALLVSRYRDRYRLLADPIVQIEQPPVAVPVGFALVPARLTAENGAKGALSGEFSIQHETTCSACYFDEADDDCEVCGGKTQYVERITVPWETIKEIYAAAVTAVAAPIAPPAPQPEQSGLVAVLERIKKDTRSDDPLDHYEIVCRALSQYRAALSAPAGEQDVNALVEVSDGLASSVKELMFVDDLDLSCQKGIVISCACKDCILDRAIRALAAHKAGGAE